MTFRVVILSARASNLVPCVQSVLAHEPTLSPDRILVVDDGARTEAEAKLPGVCWVPGVKPFIFARNANLGIRAAGTDVILLNDDARLVTHEGFSQLARQVGAQPEVGVCSAGVRGVVGNPNQRASGRGEWRAEPRTLAFVCVYLPQAVYERLGPLDERFVGYGFDDDDYCARTLGAGLRLAVWDGCVIDHTGELPSTFRSRPDLVRIFEHNRRLFREKAREGRMSADRSVDLMYLACNRLEFTRATFTALLANTDWRCVRELFVYDDGSEDGTREWLERAAADTPAPARFLPTRFGSPVATMVHFIETAAAPLLAKCDNDAMLPPAWLRQSLEVFDRHPELALLGIEAMYPHRDDVQLARSYTPAAFISGLGVYRRDAFRRSRPRPYQKWFGLEEWQKAQGPSLVRGWITPALPVFLLDRIPFEPWAGYSSAYVRRGWQRSWPKYDPACTLWHWRWPGTPGPAPAPPPARHDGDSRFLCAMRVKNEAPHLPEVLASVLPLCGRAFVFDDHSADETATVCRSFGERVTVFPSPFDGLDEARDKNYLLRKVIEAAPDWVLWIDGDEVLERTGPEKLRLAAANSRVAAYALRIAYLWDGACQVRVDGIYGRFTRPSLFRLQGQPVDQLQFHASGHGGNFHCGNVPRGLLGETQWLDVRLKHYGYMTREQRQHKYRWYNAVDPNNVLEDCYRHLAEIPGARHAPGPPQLVPWVE